jgi:hypothetical protein
MIGIHFTFLPTSLVCIVGGVARRWPGAPRKGQGENFISVPPISLFSDLHGGVMGMIRREKSRRKRVDQETRAERGILDVSVTQGHRVMM